MAARYSEEVKAAVLGALLTGQSVSEIAEAYKLPEGTVRCWKSRATGSNAIATVATEKKERIGIILVDVLYANLEATKAISAFIKDRTWLERQSAADVAVLYGVHTDKAIRLLEALGPADDGSDAEADAST